MKHYVFTVFDSKAAAYLPPFFLHTKGLAIRAFGEAACDSNHQFGRHPADFTLFCIGRWDDNTGKFEQNRSFEDLGTALGIGSLMFEELTPKAAETLDFMESVLPSAEGETANGQAKPE